MKTKYYLIACLDKEDKIQEIKEYYLLIRLNFPFLGTFKMDKENWTISSSNIVFMFKDINEMQHIHSEFKWTEIAESKKFEDYASFDSKTSYNTFLGMIGGARSGKILKKLSKQRKQSNRKAI
ncbi:hypothetical protein KUA55_10335 [Enterococcus sp. ALS3]|uniref:Uncharacterized protein n=1 Tax=Enterococcus alishanensis TaxID=1303817 RepID=A0ABS6TDZ3_9ENTE|nr:hypothetical protein [Enterococcus alishanensis]MBV7391080.1 hypothetical protein [Enterococcus alishanensis]